MRLLALTSMLFVIPVVVGHYLGVYDVSQASMICLMTSVIAHDTGHAMAQLIDIVTVRSIAIFYTFLAIVNYVRTRNMFAALTILFAISQHYLFSCGGHVIGLYMDCRLQAL